MSDEILFEIDGLTKSFDVGGKKKLIAVDGISLKIRKGEILGLVGESGCGKSTLGRTITRVYEPTAGKILYKGKDIAKLRGKDAKQYASEVQMIFQDPYASLDPRMTIGDIIKEGMKIHKIGNDAERTDRMYELLELVGLSKDHALRFPYEFSGGQRQRVGIARALAVNPEFIVCDEPVSALDVSIQAQIINLLKSLQQKLGLTLLFIAHDLSVVRYVSDRVGVMYLGSLVEIANAEELYLNPIHPYTRGLLSAIPTPDPHVEQSKVRTLLEGDVPSPIDIPVGCKFAGRCPYANKKKEDGVPKLTDIGSGHQVACFCIKEILGMMDVGNF
ncbi:MAG: ATP-binding cassette domain-containing protein [Lachnospiraceae bacterium]|nr:ATP-binding cassette domain-containing protein [Lachnospiraceae bacterium]